MMLPFGKYKGQFIEQVLAFDPQYLYWLIQQKWMEEKYELLYQQIITLLQVEKEIELSSGKKAIIDRIKEALLHRGFSEGEINVMLRKLKLIPFD